MNDRMASTDSIDHIDGIPVRSEGVAFDAEQLLSCGACSRTNPPTRLKCVYCGADLEVPSEIADRLSPTLRRLEPWEKGFNVVVTGGSSASAADLTALLRSEPEFAEVVAAAPRPLPLARVESEREAGIVARRLGELGFETTIVRDADLAAETAPKRIRGLSFSEDSIEFRLFNDDTTVNAPLSGIRTIVVGAVFKKAVEATEKRKRGETRTVDATETASDESVIDIYLAGDPVGYRILISGFDFSCLGREKGILARANMDRLRSKLVVAATNARFAGDYLAVRQALGFVWEVEVRRDSLGMKRSSLGRFDFKSVSSSSNLEQFNKYSRMQYFLA